MQQCGIRMEILHTKTNFNCIVFLWGSMREVVFYNDSIIEEVLGEKVESFTSFHTNIPLFITIIYVTSVFPLQFNGKNSYYIEVSGSNSN